MSSKAQLKKLNTAPKTFKTSKPTSLWFCIWALWKPTSATVMKKDPVSYYNEKLSENNDSAFQNNESMSHKNELASQNNQLASQNND